MSKLIRWNVPFADAFFPSVVATFATPTFTVPKGHMRLTISGRDSPDYLIQCDTVLAFSCFDESCAPQRDFNGAEMDQVKSCAWIWLESPWITSYQGCNYDKDGPVPLNHYLIFGGDNIVEFLCRYEPTISALIK